MCEGVKALSFDKREIGNMIKASKVQFRWRLQLEGHLTTIEVLSSKLSGKRRVFRDGILIADKQQFEGAFSYTFHVMQHQMTIMQHGEHFELRIDNVSFTHIHAQEQTKNQFVYEDSKAQESQPNFPFQTKKTNAQPAKFDFGSAGGSGGAPLQSSSSMASGGVTSMSGGYTGASGNRYTGASAARARQARTRQNREPSGWDEVAAAKNEVFKDSDINKEDDVRPYKAQTIAPTTQQPTSFDFNSYQQPVIEKKAETIRTGAQVASQQQSFSQYKNGFKFGGFQRQEAPPNFQKKSQAYDSYGGDLPKSGTVNAAQKAREPQASSGGANFFEFNVEEEKKAPQVAEVNLLELDSAPTQQKVTQQPAQFDFGSASAQTSDAAPSTSGFDFQFDTTGQAAQQPSNSATTESLLDLDAPSSSAPSSVSALDLLQGDVPPQIEAQAQGPSSNLEDLLTATNTGGAAASSKTQTLAALQDLDLGGKTAEQAELEHQEELMQKKIQDEESKKAEEEAKESLPISRKDAALNSLVNFSDLGNSKNDTSKAEEEGAKAIYIKPADNKTASSTFVPAAIVPSALATTAEQSAEVKAITFQPSPEVLQTAQQEAQAFSAKPTTTDSSKDVPQVATQQQTMPTSFDFGGASSNATGAETVASAKQPSAEPASGFEFTF